MKNRRKVRKPKAWEMISPLIYLADMFDYLQDRMSQRMERDAENEKQRYAPKPDTLLDRLIKEARYGETEAIKEAAKRRLRDEFDLYL